MPNGVRIGGCIGRGIEHDDERDGVIEGRGWLDEGYIWERSKERLDVADERGWFLHAKMRRGCIHGCRGRQKVVTRSRNTC